MKINALIGAIVLSVSLAALVGCTKKEEPTAPAAETQKVSNQGAATLEKAAEAAKATVHEAKAKAEEAAAAAKAKAQEIIDKAKNLVSQNKFQEALEALHGLANMQLTDEQLKTVEALKKQIQEALSKKAAAGAATTAEKALGGN